MTVISAPALAVSASLSPFDVSEWNVTFVDSRNAVLSDKEFQQLLSAAPWLLDLPRFRQLQAFGSDIVLTPEDILAIFCYTEDVEKWTQLQELYAQKKLSVNYLGNGVVEVITLPESNGILPRGGEGTVYNSLDVERGSLETRRGSKITVTVETLQRWMGGSSVSVQVVNVTYKTELPASKIVRYIDPITDKKEYTSVGFQSSAYAKIWVQTASGLFSLSQLDPHFSFIWENGYFTGTTM